jgi:5'-nucleotidase
MGVDVATFGNHEHDRALSHLNTMIAASKFPWTVSNYSTLGGFTTKANPVKPYVIINKGGVKIGVVGVNTVDTMDEVFPGNLDFTDAKGKKQSIVITDKLAPVQKAVNDAKKAGANLVIVLLHNGWNMDLGNKAVGPLVDYSSQLKGVAAVYGGHSHQKYASVANGTLVAEVRNSGVEYTRSQICVDTKTNHVLGASVDYIDKAAVTNAGYAADDATATMVAGYKAQLNGKLDVKIGSVSTVSPRGGSPAVERSGEAAIGSYTADALKARYKTDFALINGGGIRDTLPAKTYVPGATNTFNRPGTSTTAPYDVLLGDAYTIFPFGNTVSVVNITGKNLWAALENGVSQYPSAGRWPQVAGIKFTVDVSKPAFSRIVSVTKTDGTPIAADDKSYSVATVDYMVYGGDGYTQFDASKQVLKDLLVDVFTDALKADAAAGKVSTLVTDGRENVIGK